MKSMLTLTLIFALSLLCLWQPATVRAGDHLPPAPDWGQTSWGDYDNFLEWLTATLQDIKDAGYDYDGNDYITYETEYNPYRFSFMPGTPERCQMNELVRLAKNWAMQLDEDPEVLAYWEKMYVEKLLNDLGKDDDDNEPGDGSGATQPRATDDNDSGDKDRDVIATK